MKYEIRLIDKILILLLLICNESIFYIPNTNAIKYVKIAFIALSIISFIKVSFSKRRVDSYNFKFEITVILLLILLEPFNTALIYGQPLKYGYMESYIYIAYINYFYLSYIFISAKDGQKFMEKILMIISVVGSIVYIMQYIQYPSIILSGMDYRLQTRFDQPRFFVEIGIFLFSYFLFLSRLYAKKGALFINILGLCLDAFVIVFVTKTRVVIFAFILANLVLGIFFVAKTNIIKKLVMVFMLIIISIVTINNISMFEDGLIGNMITITNKEDYSYIMRMKEIEFYTDKIKDNIIFGTGEISKESNPNDNGVAYNYYIEDIGIIGVVAKFGLVIAVLLIIVSIKISKILIKNRQYNDLNSVLVSGFFLSIILMSLTISFIDVREQILFTVIMLVYIDKIRNEGNMNLINK